jgi:hypothetical protein
LIVIGMGNGAEAQGQAAKMTGGFIHGWQQA